MQQREHKGGLSFKSPQQVRERQKPQCAHINLVRSISLRPAHTAVHETELINTCRVIKETLRGGRWAAVSQGIRIKHRGRAR